MTQRTHQHRLEGLDGQNPLGYFAALGLLRVLDDDARATRTIPPRLKFVEGAKPFAEIETTHDRDALIACVLSDATSSRGAKALALRYGDDGEPCVAATPKARQDLKPSPGYARRYLDEIAAHSEEDPRSAALAQAFLSGMGGVHSAKDALVPPWNRPAPALPATGLYVPPAG